jgi:hypothetical protein
MAGETKGKRKTFFTKGTGKAYSKDLRDPVVSSGMFTKRIRGLKSKIGYYVS